MIPQSGFWIFNLITSFFVMYLVAKCVAQLRFNIGKKRIWTSVLVTLYLATMAVSLGFHHLSNQAIRLADDFKKPSDQFPISKGWGHNLSHEKRTEYSLNIAKHLFISSGEFSDYFDLDGVLREYEPTNEDRQARSEHLLFIQHIETYSNAMFLLAVAWLLVPLLGVALGFTTWLKFKLHPTHHSNGTTKVAP